MLARFADIRLICVLRDLEKVRDEGPDIVLVDLRMPRLNGKEAMEVLRQSRPAPVLVLIDAHMAPADLLKRLNSLGALNTTARGRPPRLTKLVPLFGVSQETLGRMLNVSARTAHR